MKIKGNSTNKSLDEYIEHFDLKKSLEKYGSIYPIVKSQFGLVDGRHREKLGVKDVKKIKLDSPVDHWVLRYHLLHHAKSESELVQDKIECVNGVYKALEEKKPQATKRELVKETANLLGISERTVWSYLGNVAATVAATSPAEKARQTRMLKEEKLKQERKRALLSLYNVLDRLKDKDGNPLTIFEQMREMAWARELLRDFKLIFRGRETLDLWHTYILRDGLKPSEAFARIYLESGLDGRGWTVRLPTWMRFYLERDGDNAESHLRRMLEERAREEGLSKDSFIDQARKELISKLGLWKALDDIEKYEKELEEDESGGKYNALEGMA